jgi:hypothetical protein
MLAEVISYLGLKVYLDDTREAPDGWVRAYTPDEVIRLLETSTVEEISSTHDLGLASEDGERTGYDVLRWLEAAVADRLRTTPTGWAGLAPQ